MSLTIASVANNKRATNTILSEPRSENFFTLELLRNFVVSDTHQPLFLSSSKFFYNYIGVTTGGKMTTTRLFILQGKKLEKFFTQADSLESAVFKGSVYRSKCGFPLLAKEGDDSVIGSLYDVKSIESFHSLMDEMMGFNPQNLEQSLYHRELIQVQTDSFENVIAWGYLLNPLRISAELTLIENGDW